MDVVFLDTGFLLELLKPFGDHVNADLGHRSEGPADGEDVLLVQDICCLSVPPVRGEDDRIRHAVFDQLKGQKPVVDVFEIGPIHFDHVNLHLIAAEVVVERLEEFLGLLVEKDAAVNEVDPKHANRLVLQEGVALVQSGVEDDFVGLLIGSGLELETEPTVALVGLVVIDGGDGVRKGEEMLRRVLSTVQAIHHQLVFVGEHLVHAAFADVPSVFLLPVDGIRKILVVGRHRFGDGARGSSGAEEMTDDLLARADFGERTVQVLIQVDAECFLFCREDDTVGIHGNADFSVGPVSTNVRDEQGVPLVHGGGIHISRNRYVAGRADHRVCM